MFTREGLEELVNFSKTRNISPQIRVVKLVLVSFTNQGKGHLTGEPYTRAEARANFLAVSDGPTESENLRAKIYSKRIRQMRRRAYGRHKDDQNVLRRQGEDVRLLSEALSRLPALEAIQTTDVYGEEHPWGRGSVISDLGMMPFTASMRSWIPLTRDDYASRFEVEREMKKTSGHSVGVVLGALHRSGIKFNGTLELRGIPHDLQFTKRSHCSRSSLSVTPPRSFGLDMLADMQGTLSNLKHLYVEAFIYAQRMYGNDPIDQYEVGWLNQLLQRTTGLTELELIDNGDQPFHINHHGSIPRLDAYSGIMRSIDNLSKPFVQLKVFGLFDVDCETPLFIRFMENHTTTLRRVYLDHVNLRTTSLVYVGNQLRSALSI